MLPGQVSASSPTASPRHRRPPPPSQSAPPTSSSSPPPPPKPSSSTASLFPFPSPSASFRISVTPGHASSSSSSPSPSNQTPTHLHHHTRSSSYSQRAQKSLTRIRRQSRLVQRRSSITPPPPPPPPPPPRPASPPAAPATPPTPPEHVPSVVSDNVVSSSPPPVLISDDDKDEETSALEALARRVYEQSEELARTKAELAARQQQRRQMEAVRLAERAEKLDKLAAAELDARQHLEETVDTLQADTTKAEEEEARIAEEIARLERETGLEKLTYQKLELETLREQRENLERVMWMRSLHIDSIHEERKQREAKDLTNFDNVLQHAEVLQRELESGDYDERDRARLATQLHEAIQAGRSGDDRRATFRLIDEVLAKRRQRVERLHVRSEQRIQELNRQRAELEQEHDALRTKKQQFNMLASKGVEYLTEVELGNAPPVDFLVRNADSDADSDEVDDDDVPLDDLLSSMRDGIPASELRLAELRRQHEADLLALQQRRERESALFSPGKTPTFKWMQQYVRQELLPTLLDNVIEHAQLPDTLMLQARELEKEREHHQDNVRRAEASLELMRATQSLIEEVVMEMVGDIFRELHLVNQVGVENTRTIVTTAICKKKKASKREAAKQQAMVAAAFAELAKLRQSRMERLRTTGAGRRRFAHGNPVVLLSALQQREAELDQQGRGRKKKSGWFSSNKLDKMSATQRRAWEAEQYKRDATIHMNQDDLVLEEQHEQQQQELSDDSSDDEFDAELTRVERDTGRGVDMLYPNDGAGLSPVYSCDRQWVRHASSFRYSSALYARAEGMFWGTALLEPAPTRLSLADAAGAAATKKVPKKLGLVTSIATTHKGPHVAVGTSAGHVFIFDVRWEPFVLTYRTPAKAPLASAIQAMTWNDTQTELLIINANGAVQLLAMRLQPSRKSFTQQRLLLQPVDYHRPARHESPSADELKELQPSAVAFHPALLLNARQPSLLIGLSGGTTVKWNTHTRALTLFGAARVPSEPHFARESRFRPKKSGGVRREFSQWHSRPIILIHRVRVPEEAPHYATDALVTVDSAGYMALWEYDVQHFTGFGWFAPQATSRLLPTRDTFSLVSEEDGGERVLLFCMGPNDEQWDAHAHLEQAVSTHQLSSIPVLAECLDNGDERLVFRPVSAVGQLPPANTQCHEFVVSNTGLMLEHTLVDVSSATEVGTFVDCVPTASGTELLVLSRFPQPGAERVVYSVQVVVPERGNLPMSEEEAQRLPTALDWNELAGAVDDAAASSTDALWQRLSHPTYWHSTSPGFRLQPPGFEFELGDWDVPTVVCTPALDVPGSDYAIVVVNQRGDMHSNSLPVLVFSLTTRRRVARFHVPFPAAARRHPSLEKQRVPWALQASVSVVHETDLVLYVVAPGASAVPSYRLAVDRDSIDPSVSFNSLYMQGCMPRLSELYPVHWRCRQPDRPQMGFGYVPVTHLAKEGEAAIRRAQHGQDEDDVVDELVNMYVPVQNFVRSVVEGIVKRVVGDDE